MARGIQRTLRLASFLVGSIVVPFAAGCTGGGQCGGSANCEPPRYPCPFLDGGSEAVRLMDADGGPNLPCNADTSCEGKSAIICPDGRLTDIFALSCVCRAQSVTDDAGRSVVSATFKWECITEPATCQGGT